VSHDYLAGPIDEDLIRYGRKPSLPTNRNLDRLLEEHLGLAIEETYATDLFPFVKPGCMTAAIPARDLVQAVERYALPQIDIVQPRLVIALGLAVYNALTRVLGARREETLDAAVGAPVRYSRTLISCQAHTGGLGRANRNRGSVDRVSMDWAQMSAAWEPVS